MAGVLCSVSCGLLSTIESGTHFGIIAVYQLINGAGRGLGTQMPTIAVQTANMHAIDTTIAITLLMFTQMLGTALVLAFANNIFAHSISIVLEHRMSREDVEGLIRSGIIGLNYSPEKRQELEKMGDFFKYVMRAYIVGVHNVFYVAAGFGALAVFSAFFLGWKDIRNSSVKKNWFGMSSDKEANKLRKNMPGTPRTPVRGPDTNTSFNENFNNNDNGTPIGNNTDPMLSPLPPSASAATRAERRVSRMSRMSDAADFAKFSVSPAVNPLATGTTKAERRLSRMSATAGLA